MGVVAVEIQMIKMYIIQTIKKILIKIISY